MPDIFISYSRKDSVFVQTLYDQLVAKDLTVWMDKNDIPPTRDWWISINKGIEESNAFVFVLSPHSLKSPVCHLEINYAIALKKRLIPIVRVDVDPKLIFADLITQQLDVYIEQTLGERDLMSVARQNWQEISRHNWVFFLDDESLNDRVKTLVDTLNTDYEYVQQHTQLLIRAKTWENRGYKHGFLLRAAELKEARIWLEAAIKDQKEPEPAPLHTQYINRSRAHAKRQGQFRTMLMMLLPIIGLIFGAILIWQVTQSPYKPTKMTSKFNIAVAPVYEITNETVLINDNTDLLTQKIYTEIEALRHNSQIEGFDEDDIQVALANAPAIQSAQDAEKILADYNAHIVVYGILDAHNQTFTPRYYLGSDLIGVSEITGETAFGAAIPDFPLTITNNLATETQLRMNGFDNRIKILAQFLFGLAAFQSNLYEMALEYFMIVLDNPNWDDSEGKKILYLWLGTLFDRSVLYQIPENGLGCPEEFAISDDSPVPNLACAEAAYKTAIEAAEKENPNDPFGRAYLGLGNVYQTWATALPIPICQYYTQLAIPAFEEALLIDQQAPAPTLISLKAYFNIGAAYISLSFCHGFEGNAETLEQAIDALSLALEVAESLEPSSEVLSLSAQAYYRLGGLYNRRGEPEQALLALDQAIALANPPEADLAREPNWKQVRWMAAVRKANAYLIIAERDTDLSYWQLVLDETNPVLDIYFNTRVFSGHQTLIDAFYFRGLAYEALGQPSMACEAYQRALALDTEIKEALYITDVQERLTNLSDC